MLAMISTEVGDRDLELRVRNYLLGRHMPGLRNLEVFADNGAVTVKGRVRTFYEKQVCHQCVRRVAGVQEFIDAIEVATL